MKKRRRTGRMSRFMGIPAVLFALAGWWLVRIFLRGAAGVPAFFLLLAGEVLFALLPALAGIFCIPGTGRTDDGIPDVRMLRQDFFCGMLFICPYTLLREIICRLMGAEAVPAPLDPALFFPYFLLYVLLIPVAEGLFYRVSLERHCLSGFGSWTGVLLAACFAVSGWDPALLLPRFLLALFLSVCMRRHGSVLSSMIVHGAFMMTLLFAWGLGIFQGGLGVAATFVRLGGCFLWYRSFLKVFTLPVPERKLTREALAAFREWKLTRKQKALLIFLLVLTILVPVITEVIR